MAAAGAVFATPASRLAVLAAGIFFAALVMPLTEVVNRLFVVLVSHG
jgi:hypothetical protein